MSDEVDEVFPPADPQEEFRQQCQRLNENREFAALPSINYAMYPEDIYFRDDLSDKKFFNERFIEPRTEGNGAFIARIFTAGFNFSLLTVLVLAPLFGEYEKLTDPFGALIFVSGPFGLMAWFFLWIASGGNTGGGRVTLQSSSAISPHDSNGQSRESTMAGGQALSRDGYRLWPRPFLPHSLPATGRLEAY